MSKKQHILWSIITIFIGVCVFGLPAYSRPDGAGSWGQVAAYIKRYLAGGDATGNFASITSPSANIMRTLTANTVNLSSDASGVLNLRGGLLALDTESSNGGAIYEGGSNKDMYLDTYEPSSIIRLTPDSAGEVRIVGNANVTGLLEANSFATAGGIAFPATQSASADANTLDDYEEGPWTPAYVCDGMGVSYVAQHGNYTKIGDQVNFRFALTTSATNGTNTGSLSISGLPYPAGTNKGGCVSWGIDTLSDRVTGLIDGSSITLYKLGTIDTANGNYVASGDTDYLYGSGVYFTD